MNFLAKTINSTIGSLTGSSIPYDLGERVVNGVCSDSPEPNSVWNVYEATSRKEPRVRVTVFEFDLKNPRASKYVLFARNAFMKLKSLSLLPGILNIVDFIENESFLYIISERVKPLGSVLKMGSSDYMSQYELLLFGIYQVTEALKYLNKEGSSIHGSLSKNSIFVNEAGEWKLGGFELVVNIQDLDTEILSRAFDLPTYLSTIHPPELNEQRLNYISSASPAQILKLDAYLLGVFIYGIFNPEVRSLDPAKLNKPSKLPRSLASHVKKLLHISPSIRYSVEAFLNAGMQSCFNLPLIGVSKHISELRLKSTVEKLEIFNSLDELEQLPDGFFEYKILPELITTFQSLSTNQDSQQSALLLLILKRVDQLDKEAFQHQIKPLVLRAFELPDRAIRITLLSSLPTIIDHFAPYEIQDKIFPNLVQGFNDTNSSIREATLKSVLSIADKISARQLNNDVLKYMAKLQNDSTPEIRTNTIICLSKIATYMTPSSRAAVLATAYSKALKDPFVPSRVSSLLAFENSIEYFTPEVCCSKVLSAIAPALLDKSSKVRTEAQRVFDLYFSKINEAANHLPLDSEETVNLESENSENILSRLNPLSLSSMKLKNTQSLLSGLGSNTHSGSTVSLTMKQENFSSESLNADRSLRNLSNANVEDSWNEVGNDWDSTSDYQSKSLLPHLEASQKPQESEQLKATRQIIKGIPQAPKRSLKLQPKSKLKLDLLDDDVDGWENEW
ncbi:hypothetical protein KL905_004280 [Ogataea polymorpha]|uniref:Uncharacterized protein n=1 Tax=Ogataea polymorpha TaxID=460523 RepID=A0A1B7SHC4_9ASCO|nr:uncharacterized protein OGAPODRAFT_16614 [Ogataea polymorpha]KAG7887037.1 hypothetical protein KL936_004558 [Ogataea polymorpha]KAG7893862.1 hypothetical protein KL908_002139 [Ogataea polymorpha]KAG7897206.1 hypothetical protein KL935_005397 [Ogataea polymorpha]KAG7900611.1 hypothetical protein KL907_004729 [Ogataea polymorpha]KAG7906126.1 hypothetical protein KL906_004579 [Ogataea polymorpha]